MGDFRLMNQTGGGGESIENATVTLASSSFVYDGNEKTQGVTSVVLDGVTLTENVDYVVVGNRATNAGTHTLSVLGVNEYTAAATANWTISKAQGTISVSPASLSIQGIGSTGTATITKTGDGNVSVSSSDTGKVTASVSGNAVTLTAVAAGSATITVTMADGDNYLGASCTLSAEVVTVSPTLSDNTPAQIQYAAQSGIGASLWSVGDKTAAISIGAFSDIAATTNICAFIIGFDHNSSIEGTGIHFQFGIDDRNRNICFSGLKMNSSNTNSGGWNSSLMRTTHCPAFLAALPSAWQAVIADCDKYSDNTGGGSDTASYVTKTTDKIFLLAEWEVFGAKTNANSKEKSYQQQYAYYANGNSKVKYKHNVYANTVDAWHLRSVNATGTGYFCGVNTSGWPTTLTPNTSQGFAPGFKVA